MPHDEPALPPPPAPNGAALGAPPPPTASGQRATAVLLALFGPIAIWVGLLALAFPLVSHERVEQTCREMSWDCLMSPAAGVVVIGILAGVWVVPIFTTVTTITAVALPPQRSRKAVLILLAGFAVAVVGLCLAIASRGL